MEIVLKKLSDKTLETNDFCYNAIKIEIDNKEVFYVREGEPEDNNLYRNFNDCWNVFNLMKTMYAAGKIGKKCFFDIKEVDEL